MIITAFFIILGILFMIGTLIYINKKNNLQGSALTNNKSTDNKKKLSNLWGIDEVNDSVITTNRNQHSIIIELESIEYNLLHNEEKENVDRELVSIAKMLKFPIQFLEIKNKLNLNELIEKINSNTTNSNDNIRIYANELTKHLKNITENQELFERKNYIIISSFKSKKEAETELKEFYQLLRYHLLNIKVNTRILSDKEIIELIYEQFHKNSINNIDEIKRKGGTELYVSS